jgi:cytidylate kinase
LYQISSFLQGVSYKKTGKKERIMSIIIISADSGEIEQTIARKVADAMGYTLLDDQFMEDIGAKHQIDQKLLDTELEKTPSLFNKLSACQWHHDLACIEGDVLDRLLTDNIVCHGLCAHLYVQGVSHAMKIRILTGNSRISAGIATPGGSSATRTKTDKTKTEQTPKNRSAKLDQRKKWSTAAYGCDETDLSRYDLVINMDQIDPDEAVKTITDAAKFRKFQVMTYSTKCLADLALGARVNAALLDEMSDIKVEAHDGSVVVFTRSSNRKKRDRIAKIKEIAGKIKGVDLVEVHVNT